MSLKIGEVSMPLTKKIASELELPEGSSIIVIQHGVQDAIEFALSLRETTIKSGGMVYFLPKPFSQDSTALTKGLNEWLVIHNPGNTYEWGLESDWYLKSLIDNIASQELYVIEVGWCFAKIIREEEWLRKRIKWIIEVTTFWHNRHLAYETNSLLPTFSIARSPIKEREARHVGLAIYRSIDKILHDLDRAITDAKVLIVGYGMIWKNICRAFSQCERVSVFDNSESVINQAKSEWFIHSDHPEHEFFNADIIIASTWTRSIWWDIIQKCRDGAILASGGSRQNEIDVEFLEQESSSPPETIHPFLKKYTIHGKSIYLVREWKNANFSSKSCPAFSMDLIHAETLACLKRIIKGDYSLGCSINETTFEERKELIDEHKKIWE